MRHIFLLRAAEVAKHGSAPYKGPRKPRPRLLFQTDFVIPHSPQRNRSAIDHRCATTKN